jgi:hypothetical protein
MKFRSNWPLILLLLVAAVLGVRLAWIFTRSAIGWQPHLDQWADIAAHMARIERTALSRQEPESQGRFWLNEVAGIETSDDPQLAMGAAWMLDAPQFGFSSRHVRMKKSRHPSLPTLWNPEIDFEAIRVLSDDFESLCHDECLAQIETAIRLDSDNVELWRARALLAFRTKFASRDLEPRRDDWLSVLDECAKHDPGNALYDYLAAVQLWSSSAQYGYEDDGYVLKVKNKATFVQCNARLTAGLAKPHLKFGTDGYVATMEFLDESSTAHSAHLAAAGSRQIDSRATNLMHRIMRWQSVQRDTEKREENFDAAVACVRKVLRISEQMSESGNYPNLIWQKLFLRQWSLANLDVMNKDHPNLLDADEAEKVAVDFGQVQLDMLVLQEVAKRLEAEAGKGNGAHPMLTVLLMVTAQMLVIATLGMALLSGVFGLVFGKTSDERVEMGWLRHVAVWFVGFGVSFLILGMSPAEVVSPAVQKWFLGGLVWLGFAVAMLGLLFLTRKRFPLPLGQFAVLAATMTLPIVVGMHFSAIVDLVVSAFARLHPIVSIAIFLACGWVCWKSVRLIGAFVQSDSLSVQGKVAVCVVLLVIALIAFPVGARAAVVANEFEVKAWISPNVWNEAEALQITPAELQSGMQLGSKWVWAFIQWQTHYGAIFAPLMAIGMLLIWHLRRRARRFEGGYREIFRSQKRSQIRQAGKVIASSCAVAALVFSLVYLSSTPIVADGMERYYQVHHKRLVNPSHGHDEREVATAQVKSDESLMTKLKAEIAERNR